MLPQLNQPQEVIGLTFQLAAHLETINKAHKEAKQLVRKLYPFNSFVRVSAHPEHKEQDGIVANYSSDLISVCVVLKDNVPHWIDIGVIEPIRDLRLVTPEIRRLKLWRYAVDRPYLSSGQLFQCKGCVPTELTPKLP